MIFVDTSFWAALTARNDALHDIAVDLFTRHGTERLVTSNHVRGENLDASAPTPRPPKRDLVPRWFRADGTAPVRARQPRLGGRSVALGSASATNASTRSSTRRALPSCVLSGSTRHSHSTATSPRPASASFALRPRDAQCACAGAMLPAQAHESGLLTSSSPRRLRRARRRSRRRGSRSVP